MILTSAQNSEPGSSDPSSQPERPVFGGPQVSTVLQFMFLLAPFVMTGFFLVYSLVGLILESNSHLRWCDEALEVGLFVMLIIVGMNVPVMVYAFFKRLRPKHVLWLSPMGHILIAMLLTVTIARFSGCYG